MNPRVKKFIEENNIDNKKLQAMLKYTSEIIPEVRPYFDIDTYNELGVLRIKNNYKDKEIQPSYLPH